MRDYFDCSCGTRTWQNTTGNVNDRKDMCVECWKKFLAAEGVHHCTECGAFAQKGSVLCWRCGRLHELESDLKGLRSELYDVSTERTTCQAQNRTLKVQVTQLNKTVGQLQNKKDQPFNLEVNGWSGTCSEDYLKKVLQASENVPHVFVVKYSRRT